MFTMSREKEKRSRACKISAVAKIIFFAILAAVFSSNVSTLADDGTVAGRDDGKTVRVAYVVTESFEEGEEGELKSGYGYEYLQRIAYYTGWKYEYVYGTYQESLERLADGEVDLMARISYSSAQKDDFYLSTEEQGLESYYLFGRTDEGKLDSTDYSSFNGKKIGVTIGSHAENLAREWMKNNGIDCELVVYDTLAQRNKDLNKGLLDGTIASEIFMQENWEPILKVGEGSYYFGVSKSRKDLLDELNEAMVDIKGLNPFFNEEIKSKYSNFVSVNGGILTAEEKEWLAKTPPIRVGYLENYFPYCGTDKTTGEADGLLEDFLQYMNEKYGMEFQTSGFDTYESLMSAFQGDELDVIFPVYGDYNLGEKQNFMISDPITHSTMVMMRHNKDIDDFQIIAVAKDDPFQGRYAELYFPDADVYHCADIEECLDAVQSDKADFTVVESAKVNESESAVHRGVSQKIDMQIFINISFGVKAGQTALYSTLNKGIMSMDDSEISNSLIYHVQQNVTFSFARFLMAHIVEAFLCVVAVSALIIALVIAHFSSLAKSRRDLDDAHHEAADARWDAEHDSLTGLCNRSYFRQLCLSLSESEKSLALMIIDLDKFKLINDNYGHEVGDHALVKVAMLLKAYFRDNDHVIRYAGDEFVIVMENTTDKEIDVIGARIDHINLRLKNTEDGVPPLSLSAGIAFSDTGYYEALFNQADKALYQAKTNGRCGYTVYTQDIDILHP